ncbi:trypsin beta-like [Drosophila bipectinata]|uniref:trypsin beta-like n=1 Tax=Drosophila bipectinata TaxID=42026 RepID=UPI0038B3064B
MKGQLILGVISFAFLFKIAICNEFHRIIDGYKASEAQFPYQVYFDVLDFTNLEKSSYWSYGCGGTLVSKRIILTAAHCLDSPKISAVRIYFGALSSNETLFEPGKKRLIVKRKDIIIHEDWEPHALYNDIALIKLPIDVNFNEYIQPAKLPSPTVTYIGSEATTSGWEGSLSAEEKEPVPYLKYFNVSIISIDQCYKAMFRHSYKIYPSSYICIRQSNNSPCHGDSGGPLIVHNDTDSVLVGIVSFAAGGCTENYPTVYTRVSSYLDWIRKNAGEVLNGTET